MSADKCPCCGLANEVAAALDRTGALERARVVAVLDGWAHDKFGACWWSKASTSAAGDYLCAVHWPDARAFREFHGRTVDAARAAAAKAIEAGEV